MQAYALQEAVSQNFGCECEIINYKCPIVEERYALKPHLNGGLKQKAKQLAAFAAFFSRKIKKRKHFKNFRERFFKLSSKTYDPSNIFSANSDGYDVVITGSDQIWNLMLTGGDDAYYLSWCSKRKASYAASFGFSTVPKKYEYGKARDVLSQYAAVGVRELAYLENGDDAVPNAVLTVDPTLLWGSDFWDGVRSGKYDKKKGKYILLYIIASERAVFEKAKKLSEKYGLPVYFINQSTHIEKGFENLFDVSVEDFIDLIANAHTVITTSYHGLIFSILYRKNFYIGVSNMKNNFNSRIETLLGHIELSVEDVATGNEERRSELDFYKIESLIDKKRQASKKVLENIING